MRNLFLIVIALTLFFSCKKENSGQEYEAKLQRYAEVLKEIEVINMRISEIASHMESSSGGASQAFREQLMELMSERNALEREKQRLEKELNLKSFNDENTELIKYICYS